jgi:hypothetical protein
MTTWRREVEEVERHDRAFSLSMELPLLLLKPSSQPLEDEQEGEDVSTDGSTAPQTWKLLLRILYTT